jgi:hypothetical protein
MSGANSAATFVHERTPKSEYAVQTQASMSKSNGEYHKERCPWKHEHKIKKN